MIKRAISLIIRRKVSLTMSVSVRILVYKDITLGFISRKDFYQINSLKDLNHIIKWAISLIIRTKQYTVIFTATVVFRLHIVQRYHYRLIFISRKDFIKLNLRTYIL